MPDIAIHQLPDAGALTGTEIVPVDNGTATVRSTVGAIRAGLAATTHVHALADVTGLQTALNAKAATASPTFTGPVGIGVDDAAANAVTDVLTVSHTTTGTSASGIGVGMRFQVEANGGNPDTIGRILTVVTDVANNLGYMAFFVRSLGAPASEKMRITSNGELMHGTGNTVVDASGLLSLRSYTVATLPSAATAGRLIYVSNGTANKRLAVSDGTGWRFPDGSVVS